MQMCLPSWPQVGRWDTPVGKKTNNTNNAIQELSKFYLHTQSRVYNKIAHITKI